MTTSPRGRLGATSDGRIVFDLRDVPGGVLDPTLIAELRDATADRRAVARLILVDAAVLESWARMSTDALVDMTSALYKLQSSARDQLLIAHAAGEPAPTPDPAVLFLLRDLGFEVRPFAIG